MCAQRVRVNALWQRPVGGSPDEQPVLRHPCDDSGIGEDAYAEVPQSRLVEPAQPADAVE